MSISYIDINPWMLDSRLSSVQTALSKVEKETDEMYAAVRELDAMWDGPANKAFNEQFNIDHENMLSLCETISSLLECMRSAVVRYYKGDEQVCDVINAIQV